MQAAVFAATSSIGLRVVPVGKVALERAQASVDVLGGRVGVKVAVAEGRVVNVSVEYEDVAALARELGPPGQGGAAGRHRGRRGRLPGHWPGTHHSASRRSASSGLTSSTRVMTAQRCPNGS